MLCVRALASCPERDVLLSDFLVEYVNLEEAEWSFVLRSSLSNIKMHEPGKTTERCM